MTPDEELPLEAVAERLRRAAAAEPVRSVPSPGTWEAIVAATGIGSAAAPAAPGLGRRAWLLGAGGLLAGAVLGGVTVGLIPDRPDQDDEFVRSAVLTPLEDPDDQWGTAELLRDGARHVLRVEVPEGLENPGGYVEAWLINVDGARMISVGVFAPGTSGSFLVDSALVEAGYLVVDLSREQFDDEPRHSGDTIVRGQLT
ncbi:hypothetical protein GCM10028820_26710 [Tessaracoccus terricola]